MNLCSEDHEEICYEGRTCPCCEKQKEIETLECELDSKQKEVAELSNALEDSESKVAWYKDMITPEVLKKSPELLEPFLMKE